MSNLKLELHQVWKNTNTGVREVIIDFDVHGNPILSRLGVICKKDFYDRYIFMPKGFNEITDFDFIIPEKEAVEIEEKKYIILKGTDLLLDELLTESEAINKCPNDTYCILDISKCRRCRIVVKEVLTLEKELM